MRIFNAGTLPAWRRQMFSELRSFSFPPPRFAGLWVGDNEWDGCYQISWATNHRLFTVWKTPSRREDEFQIVAQERRSIKLNVVCRLGIQEELDTFRKCLEWIQDFLGEKQS